MKRLSTATLLLLACCTTACAGQQTTQPDTMTPASTSSAAMSKEEATALVKPFYDMLGGDATLEEVQPSYHEDWVSYSDNESGRSMADTAGFVTGPLAQMIPDLEWAIKQVYVNEDTIVVRGEATGTPAGDAFMGTPIPGGKSFKFMSIDIHELKDGKIIRTYHVEDWIGAVQQVAAQ